MLLIVLGAGLLAVCSCSNPATAGTGSQAGNGYVACTVYKRGGGFAANASVVLLPNEYLSSVSGAQAAPCSKKTTTDSHGFFSIDSLEKGNYSIEVNDQNSNAVLLHCTIDTAADQKDTLLPDTLRPIGLLMGSVVFPSGSSGPNQAYVQIYGLERVASTDPDNGSFTINDVPEGTYMISIVPSSKKSKTKDLGNIKVKSGDTTDLGPVVLETR